MNKKLFKLVEVDHNLQNERREVAKPPCHFRQKHTRKYAEKALKMKNKDRPLFNDSMLYTTLDDKQFEKVLQGASSEELEEDEMIEVHVKGNKTLIHDKQFPIWNIKGYCYLAAIKVRAYPLFEWKKNILLDELARICKALRKDSDFYITEPTRFHYHLSRNYSEKAVKSGSWEAIEALARKAPRATIGGEKDKVDDDKVPILVSTNWHEWKFRMIAYLRAKGYWHVIERGDVPHKWITEQVTMATKTDDKGKVLKPATTSVVDTNVIDKDWKEWNDDNNKVLGLLALKLSSTMSVLIKSTALETWQELVKKYDTPGAAGIFTEFQRLIHFRFSADQNPATEVNSMMVSVNLLAEKGVTLPESITTMVFLNALLDSWNNIASTMLFTMQVDELKMEEIIPAVSGEWECRNMGHRSNQAAFVARSNIKKAGKKPQWQGKRPFLAAPQPQQGQSSQQGWQNVQKKQWKRPFTPYQKPNYQNSTQGPSQGQKGHNWAKNRQNRENKKLASAIRRGEDSPMKV